MSPPFFLVSREVLLAEKQILLDGPEGRHAVTVRRLRIGERVDLGDGAGAVVAGTVIEVDPPDRLRIEVVERAVFALPDPRVVVVQGLPKGDRGELAVELMTEVGVDAIVPWSASRCVAQWRGDRGERSLRKWESAAREAAKQSRRPHLPRVTAAAATGDVLAMIQSAAAAIVLHEEATSPLAAWTPPSTGEIVVVVGPEGGIAPDEIEAFTQAGAVTMRLGPSVMRTSTAGAAAASVLLAASGRWS